MGAKLKNFVEIKDLNLDQLREILLYSYNFKKERTDKNKGAKVEIIFPAA